jgi:adenine-specific DNA glycosylase
VNHQAMVRYLVGEVRLPAADVDRIVRAFTEALEARGDERDVDLDALLRSIVEQTMLPRGQVERTITAMLDLGARLDDALGPEEDRS